MAYRLIAMAVACLLVLGCTSNRIHRTEMTERSCSPHKVDGVEFQVSRDCFSHSVEIHKVGNEEHYRLYFVEFDEQGRMYDDEQLEAVFRHLAANEEKSERDDFSIVTFVHGWRHNSHAKDGNVRLAREVLEFTYLAEKAGTNPNPSQKPRKVIGVYVGWRGKSLDGFGFDFWELLSVWDRKNVAQNVAVGSVRELFSRLRNYQERINFKQYRETLRQQGTPLDKDLVLAPATAKCKEVAKDGLEDPFHCKRVRLLIVGHSFGGLLVYNAVSESLIDSVTEGLWVNPNDKNACLDEFHTPPGEERALVKSFADLIVLVNPAIEGARFEPLHQAVTRRARIPAGQRGAFCPNQRPVFVTVTAKNDFATSTAFWAARVFTTLLESTTPKVDLKQASQRDQDFVAHEEFKASLNTFGHVQRFRSHQMTRVAGAIDRKEPAWLARYCDKPSGDEVERLLWKCRCESKDVWAAYKYERPLCAVHVEELNSAQMYRGSAGNGDVSALWNRYGEPGRTHLFCGGVSVTHNPSYYHPEYYSSLDDVPERFQTRHHSSSPIWIVQSDDKSIVNNHSGINTFPFKNFIQQLYHDITIQNFNDKYFKLLEDQGKMFLGKLVSANKCEPEPATNR